MSRPVKKTTAARDEPTSIQWRGQQRLHSQTTPESVSADRPFNGEAMDQFAFRITKTLQTQIDSSDPDDPILKQFWPDDAEMIPVSGFTQDAVGDQLVMPVPGLLHKYPGRVLLTTTSVCAVHCRYCFRRHFPYQMAVASRQQWQPVLDYIQAHPEVHEVILSGGDPLSLSTDKLRGLTDQLQQIDHVTTLRIHSRTPVVLPDRVTANFIDWMKSIKLLKIMVLHVNHAKELSTRARQALMRIRDTDCLLLNQAVLLKGVNDTLKAQCDLSHHLVESGVLPYYLHLLDKVEGTAHFEVDEGRAVELVTAMRQTLPGYLVPRLARETAGESSKSVLC